MKRLASLLLLSGLALAGCSAESPCEQAAAHIDSCGVEVAPGFADGCDDRTAEAVLSLSCDKLAADGKGDGKGDGFLGWKEKGASCFVNAECSGELVCRPLTSDSGTLGFSDEFCTDRGTFGDECDSDSDCQDMLRCVGDAVVGGENGFCRKPII